MLVDSMAIKLERPNDEVLDKKIINYLKTDCTEATADEITKDVKESKVYVLIRLSTLTRKKVLNARKIGSDIQYSINEEYNSEALEALG
jgi:uncharacterized Fe-S cluster-containing MiaB family protein